jgi:hypothetical protein
MGNGRDELPLVRFRAAMLSRCPIHKADEQELVPTGRVVLPSDASLPVFLC